MYIRRYACQDTCTSISKTESQKSLITQQQLLYRVHHQHGGLLQPCQRFNVALNANHVRVMKGQGRLSGSQVPRTLKLQFKDVLFEICQLITMNSQQITANEKYMHAPFDTLIAMYTILNRFIASLFLTYYRRVNKGEGS